MWWHDDECSKGTVSHTMFIPLQLCTLQVTPWLMHMYVCMCMHVLDHGNTNNSLWPHLVAPTSCIFQM